MVENLSTLAEINKTVHENIIPMGSINNVILSGVDIMFSNDHSSSMFSCKYTTAIVGGSSITSITQIRLLAV